MRSFRPAVLALLLLIVSSRPALADATLFVSANTTPNTRGGVGGAIGAGLLIVAFELEYSSTREDTETGAPSLKVGSGNVLLQTPVAIAGFQPYFTVGAGGFHESIRDNGETGFATNIGGGAKISLAGPLRLRVDYRLLKLSDSARYTPAHRFYAGLNLKF